MNFIQLQCYFKHHQCTCFMLIIIHNTESCRGLYHDNLLIYRLTSYYPICYGTKYTTIVYNIYICVYIVYNIICNE